ncbi:Transmembrane protease serine 2 [Coemansia sp. RSA 1939]|nr:Transmembrane protease serine 2 [Coemansia sp. RSA 1939]KAJ2616438.1 Transmembrane protease serine 2 [Coemansia sp. RSA 1804]
MHFNTGTQRILAMAMVVGQVLQAVLGAVIPPALETGAIATMSKRIVNGFYMPRALAPYAVYLVFRFGEGGERVCGGSVISPDYVLTAGHCVVINGEYFPPANVTVYYGNEEVGSQTAATTLQVTGHPDFLVNGQMNLDYDLAVIKIKTITLTADSDSESESESSISSSDSTSTSSSSANVGRVPIYAGEIDAGQNLMAMGWGITQTGSLASVLQGAVVTTGDLATCRSKNSYFSSHNGPQLCTLTKLTPGMATCVGDSGTSVVISQGSTQYLAGTVSFSIIPSGETCASNNGVRYFAHPFYFIDFIASATKLSVSYLTDGAASVSSGKMVVDIMEGGSSAVTVTKTVYNTPTFSY